MILVRVVVPDARLTTVFLSACVLANKKVVCLACVGWFFEVRQGHEKHSKQGSESAEAFGRRQAGEDLQDENGKEADRLTQRDALYSKIHRRLG